VTRFVSVVLIVAFFGVATPLCAANITYKLIPPLPPEIFDGTITTDGTIGAISAGNIVGWQMNFHSGFDVFSIASNDVGAVTQCFGDNGCFQATSTSLTFGFSNTPSVFPQFDAVRSGGLGGGAATFLVVPIFADHYFLRFDTDGYFFGDPARGCCWSNENLLTTSVVPITVIGVNVAESESSTSLEIGLLSVIGVYVLKYRKARTLVET